MAVLKAKTTRRENEKKALALEAAMKEETTHLSLNFPVSLHIKMKIRAAQDKCTMTDIVTRSVREYLDK